MFLSIFGMFAERKFSQDLLMSYATSYMSSLKLNIGWHSEMYAAWSIRFETFHQEVNKKLLLLSSLYKVKNDSMNFF